MAGKYLPWRGSIQHVVCPTAFLDQWYLASDAADRSSASEAVSFLEASDLGFAVSGDHDGLIHSLVDAGFEEQGHIVNHDGLGMFASNGVGQMGLFACDAGMDDAFELSPFRPIAEDNASEGLTVERSVPVENCLSEQCDDLSPGRLARLHNLAG